MFEEGCCQQSFASNGTHVPDISGRWPSAAQLLVAFFDGNDMTTPTKDIQPIGRESVLGLKSGGDLHVDFYVILI